MSPRRRPKQQPAFHGILPVDKPAGMTSHDVVDAIRRVAGQREVGHTGTLDPAATGLLVLCLGEATKLSDHFTRMAKVYAGEMVLGAVSTTYDADGEVTPVEGARRIAEKALREGTQEFLGTIRQVPPLYSAKKVAGKRLYEYARAGEEVEVEARPVTVERFDILEYAWPRARFEVECGSGTYVRRLVHDLGEDLECGAYLSTLRRVRVGSIEIKDAPALRALQSGEARIEETLWPVTRALGDWARARVNDEGLVMLRRGHAVPAEWAPLENPAAVPEWLDFVWMLDDAGNVLAVGRYVPAPSSPPPRALSDYRGAWFQPVRQFRFLQA